MKKITKLLSVVLCLAMLMGLAVAVSAATPAEIVDAAYELESGASMSEAVTLTGEIISIDTGYSSQFSNITVTIKVDGADANKPIMCYRLKGDGADALAVGDTITVTGTIKNYNGTIEFDQGCTLDAVVKGEGEVITQPEDPKDVLDAAYALEAGASLPYEAVLTGTVVSIDTPYDEGYKNITVTIVVAGQTEQPLLCYRLKGDTAAELAVDDVITVTGTIKNYSGTIEFTNCTFVPYTEPVVAPTDPADIMEAAKALEAGESLPYESTLSGKVLSIDTEYSEQYKNITVTISVYGTEDTIQCYRLKGDTAAELAVGDEITVTGNITNYNGKIQFNAGSTFVAYEEETPEIPGTGDMGFGALIVAMMAATAGAVIISKKKEF